MKHYIITHPCAGKTYLTERRKDLLDLSQKKLHPIEKKIREVPEGTIMTGGLHELQDNCKYYMMIPSLCDLQRNIKARQKTNIKKWSTWKEIIPRREKLILFAFENNMKVYKTFDEVLNEIKK